MTRGITINCLVEVIEDRDKGLLIGRKGTVSSFENDKFWVQFDNHPIPLPFDKAELKRISRKKN